MSRRTIALALSFVAAVLSCDVRATGGEFTTPLQTQSVPMSQTNWGPGTDGGGKPLAFQQFDPTLGKLLGVEITLSTTIRNDFKMTFVNTPTPTTIYLATTRTTDPSILANPSLVQQLTDGPAVTLKGPDGHTPIFAASASTMPVDVVSRTETSGTWSSQFAVTDPNFIPPSEATFSLNRTIDASAISLMSEFIGKGTVDLPVTAAAFSSFYSDSGNGSGAVTTNAGATVTVRYFFIPEPSGLILLGTAIGFGFVVFGRRLRGRAAHPTGNSRA